MPRHPVFSRRMDDICCAFLGGPHASLQTMRNRERKWNFIVRISLPRSLSEILNPTPLFDSAKRPSSENTRDFPAKLEILVRILESQRLKDPQEVPYLRAFLRVLPRKIQRPDRLAGDVVPIEPGSGCDSLRTGNLTGIFCPKGPFPENLDQRHAQFQWPQHLNSLDRITANFRR